MDLKISRSGDGQGGWLATIAVSGFIDLSNSRELVDAGVAALGSGAALALDLSEVDFMDSTGIGGLVELDVAAQQQGRPFEVIATSQRVRRVLEITGLAERWSTA